MDPPPQAHDSAVHDPEYTMNAQGGQSTLKRWSVEVGEGPGGEALGCEGK